MSSLLEQGTWKKARAYTSAPTLLAVYQTTKRIQLIHSISLTAAASPALTRCFRVVESRSLSGRFMTLQHRKGTVHERAMDSSGNRGTSRQFNLQPSQAQSCHVMLLTCFSKARRVVLRACRAQSHNRKSTGPAGGLRTGTGRQRQRHQRQAATGNCGGQQRPATTTREEMPLLQTNLRTRRWRSAAVINGGKPRFPGRLACPGTPGTSNN